MLLVKDFSFVIYGFKLLKFQVLVVYMNDYIALSLVILFIMSYELNLCGLS